MIMLPEFQLGSEVLGGFTDVSLKITMSSDK